MDSGTVIAGKYRLNQLLGSGGMAEVWSATHTFTERQLAIKFMNMQVGKTPEAAARFLKEAKVSARVNHPNVIEIHDVGQTEDGQLFLVMELLTGFPLEVAIRRQTPPMSLYEFALVMVEVGDALAAAHKSGIVHRDLKPTNIFLHKVRDGVAMPKLLDFGVSKFLEDDQNHALTVAGTVLGSPLYMSPEQARGDGNLDGRTDIFAFGAILFEALCGYRAYEAKNFNALIVKIATSRPKSIDECAPAVPESLRAIVRACLEPRIELRAQTCDEVVARLRAALPELEASQLRLPTPLIATAVVDPEATNALPVLRASDRPSAGSSSYSSYPPPGLSVPTPPGALSAPNIPMSLSSSIPPGAIPYPTSSTGPSWHTPNTSYASITVSAARARSHTWVFAALGVLLAVGLVVGVGLGWRSRSSAAATTSATLAAKPQEHPAPPPPVDPGPPSVSVDSLPGTDARGRGAAHPSGRLHVSATPGSCILSIDGKERGPTPLANVELPTGPHQLRCDVPGGKSRSATVTVQDANTRYKFALDE